jgi:hypothetical protein
MLVLGLAFAWFLGLRLDLRPLLWWLPFASIVLLLVVDRRPLFGVVRPALPWIHQA